MPLDVDAAQRSLSRLGGRMGVDAATAARGVLRAVVAQMSHALRLVTLRRGHDPRDFTFVAFGGAGPLHAALLARELDVARTVIPPAPGHFSALRDAARRPPRGRRPNARRTARSGDGRAAVRPARGRSGGRARTGGGRAPRPAVRAAALRGPGAHARGAAWRRTDRRHPPRTPAGSFRRRVRGDVRIPPTHRGRARRGARERLGGAGRTGRVDRPQPRRHRSSVRATSTSTSTAAFSERPWSSAEPSRPAIALRDPASSRSRPRPCSSCPDSPSRWTGSRTS